MAELPKPAAKSKLPKGTKNASLQYIPRQVFMLCDEDLPKAKSKHQEIFSAKSKADELQHEKSGNNCTANATWSPLMDGIVCDLPPGVAGCSDPSTPGWRRLMQGCSLWHQQEFPTTSFQSIQSIEYRYDLFLELDILQPGYDKEYMEWMKSSWMKEHDSLKKQEMV